MKSARIAVVLAFAACGQVYADPVTTPFVTPRVDAGGGTVTTPRRPRPPCPSQVARENAPCANVGAICEYGDSPDPTCNVTFECVKEPKFSSYWTERTASRCALECPEASAIVDGAPCDLGPDGGGDEAEVLCVNGLQICACTTGPGGASSHPRRWVCIEPEPDCPSERPLLGQICVGQHTCDYGGCKFKNGTRMICEDEVWQVEGVPCD